MASAVEALESASTKLSDATDAALVAMNVLDGVSSKLSGEAHNAACRMADVSQAVKRAASALAEAGA